MRAQLGQYVPEYAEAPEEEAIEEEGKKQERGRCCAEANGGGWHILMLVEAIPSDSCEMDGD